jgi:hypothetical protein
MQSMCNVTLKLFLVTIVAVEKQQVCITHSECVSSTLGVQHAMSMRHMIICYMPSSTIFFHII